jgi:hypothetical protein
MAAMKLLCMTLILVVLVLSVECRRKGNLKTFILASISNLNYVVYVVGSIEYILDISSNTNDKYGLHASYKFY